jgi:hypothetical protein
MQECGYDYDYDYGNSYKSWTCAKKCRLVYSATLHVLIGCVRSCASDTC